MGSLIIMGNLLFFSPSFLWCFSQRCMTYSCHISILLYYGKTVVQSSCHISILLFKMLVFMLSKTMMRFNEEIKSQSHFYEQLNTLDQQPRWMDPKRIMEEETSWVCTNRFRIIWFIFLFSLNNYLWYFKVLKPGWWNNMRVLWKNNFRLKIVIHFFF